MKSVRRRGAARPVAAALAAGLLAMGAIATAGPAAAEDAPQNTQSMQNTPQNAGGASATLGKLTVSDWVTVESPQKGPVRAGLFTMDVDKGGSLQTYCIDINTGTVEGAHYKEAGWRESSLQGNADAGRIRWILQNSYPQVNDLTALAQKAGVGSLDDRQAAAGTQVAIWRYSDHAKVKAVSPAAQKLADYLYDHAENQDEPGASLSLTPPAVSGRPGRRLGPVTVHTKADSVTLTPGPEAASRGVRVTDKNGKPVKTTADGGQLFFQVPAGAADGAASITASATTKVPVGRVLTGDGIRTQTMVLAGSSDGSVTANATVTWAKQGPAPAVSAKRDCARGGVEITVDNRGDRPFGYRIAGRKHTVAAGRSETTLVKVGEDQNYKIGVTGPGGLDRTFTGVLDCRTGIAAPAPTGEALVTQAGRGGTGSTGGSGTDGRPLAQTGGGSTAPLIAGVGGALIAAGGAVVFLLRRKRTAAGK
ncbi:thioester domain-containing protein [Streptomyces orinoci]|uniref:Thioester domain-containing protein n=1 Tax=Streptomyces orinoci TaxID=67339 RepID=A0ABV3JQK5_STRON|nr:thioester domain-containing protein [Streptomyces orinoci]